MSIRFRLAATAILCTSLIACGGGGDSSASPDAPAVTQIAVQSSGGDLSKYEGTWTSSGCGIGLVIGGGATSGTDSYQFAAPVSTTVVTGTYTGYRYANTSCSGSPTVNTLLFTATFIASVPAVTSTGSTQLVGTADRMRFERRRLDGIGFSPEDTYFTFSDNESKLRNSSTATFSSSTLQLNRLPRR